MEIDSRRSAAEQERRSPLTSDRHGRHTNVPQVPDPTAAAETAFTPWLDYPPSRWTNAHVVGFLEALKVPERGLTLALEHDVQGVDLIAIVKGEDAVAVLQEDLGIDSRLTIRQVMGRLDIFIKQEQQSEQAFQGTVVQPTAALLLAGERAMKMPTVPNPHGGNDYPNPQEYKLFMQDVK